MRSRLSKAAGIEMAGRKIVTKETQEGCLSFLINQFSELFGVLKIAGSLSKRFFDKLRRLPSEAQSCIFEEGRPI